MGIVNVTPDSFYDGGRYFLKSQDTAKTLAHCEGLLKNGAGILDIGAESSRPGAAPLALDAELERLLPVVRQVVKWGVPISVDTYKAEVMQAVLDLGADIINDIWALRQPGARQAVAAHASCGVCLMHMHRDPQTMQTHAMQGNVVQQVKDFWEKSAKTLVGAGVSPSRVVLDPGIGFGKTAAQNFSLLAHQAELLALGYPLLVGWSRKSSLGSLEVALDQQKNTENRMVPSVAAALLAVERGAKLVRVHDVRETVQALKVWRAATFEAGKAVSTCAIEAQT